MFPLKFSFSFTRSTICTNTVSPGLLNTSREQFSLQFHAPFPVIEFSHYYTYNFFCERLFKTFLQRTSCFFNLFLQKLKLVIKIHILIILFYNFFRFLFNNFSSENEKHTSERWEFQCDTESFFSSRRVFRFLTKPNIF